MKKIICVLLSLVFIFSLVSCNTEPQIVVSDPNAGYTIEKEDGEYYLVMDEIYSGADDSLNCEVHPEIHFKSVKEMRDRFLSGSFTDEEKKHMAFFSLLKGGSENGKLKIVDLDNLYEITLPLGVNCNHIYWTGGTNYGWNFNQIDSLKIVDKEIYEENYQRYFAVESNKKYEKIEKDNERNATVYYYYRDTVKAKDCIYSLDVANGEIHVRETYILESSITYPNCSDTIPYEIVLFGKVNDRYFICFIYSCQNNSQRPEVEWLSQFGVEPVKFE